MNTATWIVLAVSLLLLAGGCYGYYRFDRWLDKKMNRSCWDQFMAYVTIGIVSLVVVIVLFFIAAVVVAFLGGATVFTLLMIPVHFNFSLWAIFLYGGALTLLIIAGRVLFGSWMAKLKEKELRELRN